MTFTPWPNKLVREIAEWLVEHRDADYDEKHAVIMGALSPLSREELLHYATNNFLAADLLLVASQYVPEMHSKALQTGARLHANVERRKRVTTGKAGADASHQTHRKKREEYKAAWLSGSYRTKTACADALSKSGPVAYATVINALRNLPNPDPWPARGK